MRHRFHIFLVMMLVAAVSCVRRPLDLELESGAAVTVVAHWDSTGMRPDGMTVMFFPANGGKPTVKLSNSDTARVVLGEGEYRMLVFNETTTDFEDVRFDELSDGAAIYAYTVDGNGSFYDNIREMPEKLASYVQDGIVITEEMAGRSVYYRRGTQAPDIRREDLTLHAWPRIITCTVRLKVWIDHVDKLASAGGYLCHFSSGIRMAGGRPLKEEATYKVSFEELVETGDRKGYLYKEFCGFGFYDGIFEPLEGYTFDFFAVIADGSGFRERKWIDENITWHYGPYGELFIDIEIYPHIIIPDVRGNQAWNIGVDEWDNENIHILL